MHLQCCPGGRVLRAGSLHTQGYEAGRQGSLGAEQDTAGVDQPHAVRNAHPGRPGGPARRPDHRGHGGPLGDLDPQRAGPGPADLDREHRRQGGDPLLGGAGVHPGQRRPAADRDGPLDLGRAHPDRSHDLDPVHGQPARPEQDPGQAQDRHEQQQGPGEAAYAA